MFFLSSLITFLIGSIPFGYIIAKYKGVDIRTQGSGNIGATNVSRVLGKKLGIMVLILDVLKGYFAVTLAFILTLPNINSLPSYYMFVFILSAILGHCFSPFLEFKGGKGVATGLGAFFVVAPTAILIAIFIFLAVLFLTRYVSLASILASLSLPYLLVALEDIRSYSEPSFYLTLLAVIVVVAKHKQNLVRLLKREESKFIRKK